MIRARPANVREMFHWSVSEPRELAKIYEEFSAAEVEPKTVARDARDFDEKRLHAEWSLRPSNVVPLSRERQSRNPRLKLCFRAQVVDCSARFYESDCQGRFSSSLIAFRSPQQSAPTVPRATRVRWNGWAEQSYASDASSMPLSIHWRRSQAQPAITRGCRPWFYLRLTAARTAYGLTLLLVIRGGLWLDECLDVTDCRAERP